MFNYLYYFDIDYCVIICEICLQFFFVPFFYLFCVDIIKQIMIKNSDEVHLKMKCIFDKKSEVLLCYYYSEEE